MKDTTAEIQAKCFEVRWLSGVEWRLGRASGAYAEHLVSNEQQTRKLGSSGTLSLHWS